MIVKTYSELKFFIEMFKNGNADLLVIEGPGGCGKSKVTDSIMQESRHLKILAHITPMQLFILGYKFRDLPVIIDDVDCLLYNEQNVSLLKMFCETTETKSLAWLTTSNLLEEKEIPQRYYTKSKVLILTNDFNVLTKKIGALMDRGWLIQFQPNREELLNKIKEIKDSCENGLTSEEKNEIYNLIERFSKFCKFSLRTFMKGMMLYKECNNGKHLNWKEKLLREMNINSKLVLINELLTRYDNDKERLAEWEKKYSIRSFYNYKAVFLQKCT